MRTLVRAAVAALLVATPALAQDEKKEKKVTETEIEVTVPETRQLENGLTLLLVEKHTVPLVTIEIAVRAGSFVEDEKTNGLSHLYEHMFFKGNKTLPTQEAYMHRLQELGISFNGTTGTERVNYFITLPAKNFSSGMKFMSDALLTPLFQDEEFVKERKVVIGEYDRNESSPGHFLFEALRKGMYGKDEIRKNPLGQREIILSAGKEVMEGFKKRLYIPNNAALVIAGDVNPTEAVALAEKFFGPAAWARGADPFDPPLPPMERLADSKSFVVTRDKAPTLLVTSWNGPDAGRDPKATYAADIWGTLCAQRQGRFQKALVDSGLATSASFGYQTQREGGEIHFMANVPGPKVLELRDAMVKELAAMASDGDYFNDEDLALAKRSIKVERAFEQESAQNLAHNLTFWWASTGLDYYRGYLDEIENVSLDDVRAFLKQYVIGRPLVIGCLAPTKKAEALGLDDKKLALDRVGTGATSEVAEVTLSNGVRAIVRHDAQSKVGALEVYFRGGSAVLTPDTQGVEHLALSVALEATKDMTKEQLGRELERLGARVSYDANYDYSRVGIAAPCASDGSGLDRAIELLAACLEKPAMNEETVKQKRGEMKNRLENERSNPDAFLSRVCNTSFFTGHPYANRPDGSLDCVDKLDKAALESALKAALRSGRVLLVLVSPLDATAAKEMLQKSFGFIAKDDAQPPAAPPFKPEKRMVFEKREEIPTVYILGKTEMPAPGAPDYHATRMATNILRQRLWESVRTKHSLSYAVSAGIAGYHSNFGTIYVTATDVGKTIEVMRDELRRLKSEPVSKDDVASAVAEEGTHRLMSIEPAASHAAALGHAELVGGGWKRVYDETEMLATVTPEAIRQAARAHLKGWVFGVIGKETFEPEKIDTGPVDGE